MKLAYTPSLEYIFPHPCFCELCQDSIQFLSLLSKEVDGCILPSDNSNPLLWMSIKRRREEVSGGSIECSREDEAMRKDLAEPMTSKEGCTWLGVQGFVGTG